MSAPVRPWRRGAISSPGQIPPGGGSGYDRPEPEPAPFRRIFPPADPVKFCVRRGEECEGHFPASDDSECCRWCRSDLRTEAELNDIDTTLPEAELIERLAKIRKLEEEVLLHLFIAGRERDHGAHRAARSHRGRATRRLVERAVIIEKAAA